MLSVGLSDGFKVQPGWMHPTANH